MIVRKQHGYQLVRLDTGEIIPESHRATYDALHDELIRNNYTVGPNAPVVQPH